MANKQVNLTEQQLREIISETVRIKMNEDNFASRWWNRKKIDNLACQAHTYAQEYQNSGNKDDYDNYEWVLSQLRKYDKRKAAEIEDEWSGVINPQESDSEGSISWVNDENDEQPGEPFDYGLGSHNLQGDEVGSNNEFDWSQFEDQPNPIIGGENGDNDDYQSQEQAEEQPSQEAPAEPETTPEQPQAEPEQQAAPEPQQPAAPAYQRGKGYNLTFNQENEDVFNNYISPAYNSVTNAMKALQNLEQLGEQKYNETSKIWNDYGSSNISGAQANYKQVCQQINSILPTLQSIKAEMKQILYANGVRQTADYQHFGMEESKLRQIVSNSIQKILKENLVRKNK